MITPIAKVKSTRSFSAKYSRAAANSLSGAPVSEISVMVSAQASAARQDEVHVFQRPEPWCAHAQLRVERDADAAQFNDRLAHVGSFT